MNRYERAMSINYYLLYKDKVYNGYVNIESADLNKNNQFPLSMQKDLRIIHKDELTIGMTRD